MPSFYYGSDQGQSYWINLDHVSWVKQSEQELILKMLDGNIVKIDGEDYDALNEFIISNTVNWGYLFDERPVDYGYDNSQSTDDDHLDIEPPTGIPI